MNDNEQYPLPESLSSYNAEHYFWGANSQAWKLLNLESMTVFEEIIPPGDGENWHVHDAAHQFFYILHGEAEMQFAEGVRVILPGEGLHIRPGLIHRIFNPSDADLKFLVISSPSTREDRREVPNPRL